MVFLASIGIASSIPNSAIASSNQNINVEKNYNKDVETNRDKDFYNSLKVNLSIQSQVDYKKKDLVYVQGEYDKNDSHWKEIGKVKSGITSLNSKEIIVNPKKDKHSGTTMHEIAHSREYFVYNIPNFLSGGNLEKWKQGEY